MEKPTYFEDQYASKFLAGQTVFPDDGRIFHRPGFVYDDVAALGNAVLDEEGLSVDLFFRSGAAGVLSIQPIRPGILRIRLGRPGVAFDETSPMLLPFPEERPALELAETSDGYTLDVWRLSPGAG